MNEILLSFDLEEFDLPLEYGKHIALKDQIKVSEDGTKIILEILKEHEIKATFFTTVIFARHTPGVIQRIVDEGHELASHGYYHSKFETLHLTQSKEELEKISGQKIYGFRMPRMMSVDDKLLVEAGYRYNSSLNPTYLPGRYNNFLKKRTLFRQAGLLQIPASCTPVVRVPLFWLSFHNLPLSMYKAASWITIKTDRYLNLYFHPWEFQDLQDVRYGLPKFITRNSGHEMVVRFTALLSWMKQNGYFFTTIKNFLSSK